MTAFLTVEGQGHSRRLPTGRPDDLHRLADRSSGRDHIIHDEDAPVERAADHVAAFAMFLRFLAVECVRNAAVVLFRECNDRRGGERNALVGGTEEHVERDAGADDGCRVAASEHQGGLTVAEQPGVEEIGTLATRFEPELAEAQGIARQRELDEVELVLVHQGNPVEAHRLGCARRCAGRRTLSMSAPPLRSAVPL